MDALALSGIPLEITPPARLQAMEPQQLIRELDGHIGTLLAEIGDAHNFFEHISTSGGADSPMASAAGLCATLMRQLDTRANEMESILTALNTAAREEMQ